MKRAGNRPEAIGNGEDGSSRSFWPIASRLLPIACSGAALALVFWGLWQLDLPLARFLRSVHVTWLEQAGNVGNRLGSGAVLVAVSVAMAAAGWLLKRTALYQAGYEGLLAHGAAALVTQVLKHLIGRPRPRMMHSGGLQFGPSFDTGLDSFPSGHTAASFAVATVVARHFPRLAWPLYGVASLVAVSRIMRGSHFPTDAAAGVVLGVLAGTVVANPLRQWRVSLVQALRSFTPYLILVFALLWTLSHPLPDEEINRLMLGAGVGAIGIGLVGRFAWRFWTKPDVLDLQVVNFVLCLGLALTTGSMLIMLLVLLVTVAWRLAPSHSHVRSDPGTGSAGSRKLDGLGLARALMAESVIVALVAAAVVALQALKGLLPLL